MKNTLTILCFILFVNEAMAQFSLGLKLGSHLPTAGMSLPGFVQVDQDGTQTALVATLGAGVDFNAMLLYHFNDNVAMNVDIGYLSGFKGGFHQYVDLTGSGSLTKIDVDFKGKFFSVTPGVVITANGKENGLRPYARLGIHMGSSVVKATTRMSVFQGQSIDEFSGGWTVGLISGVGFSKSLNSKINTFFELTVKTITARPKQKENLENFQGQAKNGTIKYVKEIDSNSSDNEELLSPIPLSSVGICIGLQYRLSSN